MAAVHPVIYEPAKIVQDKSYSCIERVLIQSIESEMKEKYPNIVGDLKKKVSTEADGV